MLHEPPRPSPHTLKENVVNFFTGKPFQKTNKSFIRIVPEYDGVEALYRNVRAPKKIFGLNIICWGLTENGDVVGLVPWLNKIVAGSDIDASLYGSFEGYHNPQLGTVSTLSPEHKVAELRTAAHLYLGESPDKSAELLQEIPDTVGTHAVFNKPSCNQLFLAEIQSWKLTQNGQLQGMIINQNKVKTTPVLPGDQCLSVAQGRKHFRYFFQYHIANKLKSKDPETLSAVATLMQNNYSCF